MKRLISIILSIMMLCSVFTGLSSTVTAAEDTVSSVGLKSGDYEYQILSDGTAEITDFLSGAENVQIPSTLDGYTVTSLGYRAFDDCVNLKSVIIPNTITNIQDYVFRDCANLKSIKIPASVKTIGDWAFENCTSLNSITLPDADVSIGRETFINTGYFNNINNWRDGVLYIGTFLISAKEDLKGSYQVIEGTKRMGSHAFLYCRQVTEVVFPDTMLSIGVSAFCSCTGLKKVVIPEGVTTIGDYAFDWCTVIENITLPESIETIGARAFEYCGKLTEINIPDNVTIIGERAFDNCTSLNNIMLGKNLETIGEYAFNECTGLEKVLINDGIKNISENAFFGCSKINHVHFDGSQEQWNVIEIAATGNTALTNAPRYYNEDVKTSEFKPTCTEDGYTRYYCDLCEYAYTVTHEALGHTMAVDEAVAPTCTQTGLTEGSHCSGCSKVFVEQEVVPALGHTEVIDEAYEPTCDKEGLTEGSHCSACNEVFVAQKEIPALGHIWQPWLVLTQRLHCRDGVLIRVCTVCEGCDFKVIESEEKHNVETTGKKSATYFANGYTGDTSCTDCGTKISKGESILKLKLKTPTVKYVGGKKKLTVKYTKVSDATGFQVVYKKGGRSVTKTFNTKKTATKTISNLKKGTYKVQVRAFVKQGNKTAYSSWTKVKNVKVK